MNTFHMSFGEMTITLDDIPILVGIPVMGRSVSLPQRINDSGDAIKKVISVLATPTISINGNLYLLVLYVQSIIKTRGNTCNKSMLAG